MPDARAPLLPPGNPLTDLQQELAALAASLVDAARHTAAIAPILNGLHTDTRDAIARAVGYVAEDAREERGRLADQVRDVQRQVAALARQLEELDGTARKPEPQ